MAYETTVMLGVLGTVALLDLYIIAIFANEYLFGGRHWRRWPVVITGPALCCFASTVTVGFVLGIGILIQVAIGSI